MLFIPAIVGVAMTMRIVVVAALIDRTAMPAPASTLTIPRSLIAGIASAKYDRQYGGESQWDIYRAEMPALLANERKPTAIFSLPTRTPASSAAADDEV